MKIISHSHISTFRNFTDTKDYYLCITVLHDSIFFVLYINLQQNDYNFHGEVFN